MGGGTDIVICHAENVSRGHERHIEKKKKDKSGSVQDMAIRSSNVG